MEAPLGGRLGMGVHDRQVVAVVLEEPDLGVDLELESVPRPGGVSPGLVPDGDVFAQDEQAAGLVRSLRARVLGDRPANLVGDYHQSLVASSPRSPFHRGAERYFQPPSARTHATTPSSRSFARRA